MNNTPPCACLNAARTLSAPFPLFSCDAEVSTKLSLVTTPKDRRNAKARRAKVFLPLPALPVTHMPPGHELLSVAPPTPLLVFFDSASSTICLAWAKNHRAEPSIASLPQPTIWSTLNCAFARFRWISSGLSSSTPKSEGRRFSFEAMSSPPRSCLSFLRVIARSSMSLARYLRKKKDGESQLCTSMQHRAHTAHTSTRKHTQAHTSTPHPRHNTHGTPTHSIETWR